MFHFMEVIHEPLHLDKLSLVQKRSSAYLQVLFELLLYLTKLLNVAMVRNIEVILGQMLHHSVEFCDFVQCHIFLAYFPYKGR
jgi:hypothetical protein